ncbi:MAG: antibiotic biosynthesis monooxygenase family protein [Gaiellaceae bacterium]
MLVVSRFVAAPDDLEEKARTALAVLAGRAGFVRGSLGRAADDPSAWVLVTEWVGVGAWRRALSSYDVKVHASPLLALGRDEPSAFEVLVTTDGDGTRERGSDRAE